MRSLVKATPRHTLSPSPSWCRATPPPISPNNDLTPYRHRVTLLIVRTRRNIQRDKGRIVRLTVYLPEDLHRAVMHRCIDETTSFTKLAEQLLRDYLEKPPKPRKGK